ncbi:prepilin-type N-terminal cleavage/methylation domain-containing protein [Coraliomargarita sp. SDUM461004]|uniref:Prepilin-type N-terminal cleavage/methylation domain-containing protein n=2 Tax=Thalassobacterium sedimentorum TaxID=3041258 RepID=A0ABU1AE20_9BACT|nr:prepilin-type N-terminal cleavage/methylation domain-containing protein [Coraliomargarita sp. SDUM461004]
MTDDRSISPMNPKDFHCNAAFTLIELLCVIAVIAILSAILIPTAGRIRESANATKCVSNLRTIGQTIGLIVAENGDYPPAVASSYSAISQSGAIAKKAGYGTDKFPREAYEKSDANHIFNCPSSEATNSYRDYALNAIVMGWQASSYNPLYKPINPINIPDLPDTILVTDNAADNLVPQTRQYFDINIWPYTENIGARHNGKANILFADYHVAAVDPATIEPEQIDPKLQ